jgi:hypothetical protein
MIPSVLLECSARKPAVERELRNSSAASSEGLLIKVWWYEFNRL